MFLNASTGWPKFLAKHLRRRVRDPVGHQQRIEFGEFAVVEGDDKLAAIRVQALQRMGQARREIPEIAFLHVGHLRTAHRVQNRHPAVAVGHHRPFGLLVPMKLANAAWPEAHVDAGDRRRDLEVILRDLARPTAILDSLGRKIERGPVLRHAVDVGCRRIKEGGLVSGEALILRAGIRQRLRIGDIDRAFGRFIWVAEGGRTRRGRRTMPCRRRPR